MLRQAGVRAGPVVREQERAEAQPCNCGAHGIGLPYERGGGADLFSKARHIVAPQSVAVENGGVQFEGWAGFESEKHKTCELMLRQAGVPADPVVHEQARAEALPCNCGAPGIGLS